MSVRRVWRHLSTIANSPQQLHNTVVPQSPAPLSSPTAILQRPVLSADELSTRIALVKSALSGRQSVTVLTGAGVSTDSGIPDYRSPGRPVHNPITHQQFAKSHRSRQRYWARSMIGYERMITAQPNDIHKLLAQQQTRRRIQPIITQNVDNLHERAGSTNVTHLHGNIHSVRCLSCHHTFARSDMQTMLEEANPDFTAHVKQLITRALAIHSSQVQREGQAENTDHGSEHVNGQEHAEPVAALIPHGHDEDTADMVSKSASLRPDGDIELSNESYYEHIVYPPCPQCHDGILKPDVVFFGANVPQQVAAEAERQVTDSDALIVVGSSLTVWSAYRLIKKALLQKAVIAIVNDGPTRADNEIRDEFKLTARAGYVLKQLFDFSK